MYAGGAGLGRGGGIVPPWLVGAQAQIISGQSLFKQGTLAFSFPQRVDWSTHQIFSTMPATGRSGLVLATCEVGVTDHTPWSLLSHGPSKILLYESRRNRQY